MAPGNPTLINCKSDIVNLKWVNLKYKTDCFIWKKPELRLCHFAFQCSAQWPVERISYSSIVYTKVWYASGTSKDNEWINLHRFWVHLLLLFAITSRVMRNYLFVFKIFIRTPYCRQKNQTFTEMITRCHWMSLFVTCCHLLSLVVRLVVTSCHSMYHSLSFVVTRYITRLPFYQRS